MIERAVLFRRGNHIEGVARNIDDRRTSDPNLRQNVTRVHIGSRHRCNPCLGIQEVNSPQGRRSRRVGVERINAVVLRCHNHDIVDPVARHCDLRQVQRLSVDRAVDRKRVQSAEMRGVHVEGRENGFDDVLAGASVIIVIGSDHGQSGSSQRFGSHAWRTR